MLNFMVIQVFRSIIALFGLLMLLSSCSPRPQTDCGFVQNIYGQRISWKTTQPIPFYIHHTIPQELRPAIYRAAATWEKNAGRKVFEISEDSSKLSAGPQRDKKNGIYFLGNWESDRQSEQGRTSVYWAGDEIQEADIRINAADFSYYDQNPTVLIGSYAQANSGHGQTSSLQSKKDGYNFEALVLHELGHFLGLRHREEAGSVMATHLSAYNDRTRLADADQGSVSCEY